jgi:hypothetical protein
MLKRMASLATVVALLLLAAGPSACQSQGETEPEPAAGEPAEEVAPPDSAPADEVEEPAREDEAADEAEQATEAEETEEATEAEETQEAAEPVATGEIAEPEPGAVAPSGLQVFRAYICKGIEQSEPTEAGKSFIQTADGVLRLCCFSEIGGASRPDTVFHVWYWGEREMARVPLRVQGARWRTWSSKRIIDEWRGDWQVHIVDRAGFVLQRLTFSVE